MTSHHGIETPETVARNRNRTPEEIQREFGETRDRIHSGLDDRLGTGGAIRDAAHHVRESAGEWTASVGRVIRDNPVPAFLIGAGAAWIAVSALSHTERGEAIRHRLDERTRDYRYRAGEAAHRASDRTHALGHRASEAAASAKERAAELGHRAREVSHRATETFESQPLLIGALGLAVGAAIGASMPSTRREDELVGPHRDHLKHSVTKYSQEQVARAGDAAHETIEAARRETGKITNPPAMGPNETKNNTSINGPAPKDNGGGV